MLSPVLTLAQADSLLIRGTIKQGADGEAEKVVFTYVDQESKSQRTSANLTSSKFELRVPKQTVITEGMLRTVSKEYTAGGAMQRPISLFIKDADIIIQGQTDELDLAIVSGGKENDDYNTLRQSTADITRATTKLFVPIIAGTIKSDTEEGEKVMKQMSELRLQDYVAQKRFISEHPDSYVSLFLLSRFKNIYTSHDYEVAFSSLAPQYRATKLGREIQGKIEQESVTAKGKAAQRFTRTTATGKPFKLEDLKGNVFLIDFWGSWCGPCRASMPHLLDLYKKYKGDGFEIVGVAQERGKTMAESNESWKKAIDELGIHWVNVLNNENKEQFDIVKAYAISGFPTKILVDAQGKIILRITASATDDIDVALKKIYGY